MYKIIDNVTLLTGLTDNITALKTIILRIMINKSHYLLVVILTLAAVALANGIDDEISTITRLIISQ